MKKAYGTPHSPEKRFRGKDAKLAVNPVWLQIQALYPLCASVLTGKMGIIATTVGKIANIFGGLTMCLAVCLPF